jgi:hypothetical protein
MSVAAISLDSIDLRFVFDPRPREGGDDLPAARRLGCEVEATLGKTRPIV